MIIIDEETTEQSAFNIQWYSFLDLIDNSGKITYVCPRSILNMRSVMTKYGLYERVLDADTSPRRIDYVHIFLNMKHLDHIGIFTGTIKKFLLNLKRRHKTEFNGLDLSPRERCLKKAEESSFFPVKPSESAETLRTVADDLFFLVERFGTYRSIPSMKSYQFMMRIFKEQRITEQDENTAGQRVSLKANKDISSASLQNPSDPDAGYSGHKGKGYQVQIAETYSIEEGEDSDRLSLITHVDVQATHESDADTLMPYIEATERRGVKPEESLADTIYGGDDNHEASKKKDRFTIAFDSEACSVRPAQRRSYERTDDFKNKYRFRTGVEATMSRLDRRAGIKHLRARGMKAVRFAATMKATALNIIRAAAYKKRRNKGENPSSPSFGGFIGLISFVKKHFCENFDNTATIKNAVPFF